MKKEFILCAAIYVNDETHHDQQPDNIKEGFVVCGRRHGDCYATMKAIVGFGENIQNGIVANKTLDADRNHQGFITSTNRYVSREEGWIIAKREGQVQFGLKATEPVTLNINGKLETFGEDPAILISENLY